MTFKRRAVIDIGTNSVKLLVADVAGREVKPIVEDSRQTRLGEGFYETHQLQPEPIKRTVEAIEEFLGIAHKQKAANVRLVATSAARDAKNSRDLTAAIQKTSGLAVEIISGGQEASWAFQGVTTDPELAQCPLLLLDVGGGSTEFILGHGEQKDFQHSFALGTVRLLETIRPSDPPKPDEFARCRNGIREFLKNEVRSRIQKELDSEKELGLRQQHQVQLVGTGGTATILARMEAKMEDYDRTKIEATRLSLNQITAHAEKLWQMPLAERKTIVGLPPKRADVILMGVTIYEAVMAEFGFVDLRVSTRGLRFAALMDGN
jgi:exopolyphosphatase/guanosine-5'-triphosphate,3'-diphosphate pyrophosphatase